ncbi:MAG: tyrosine-type recombinase/integrase [Pseudonocardiales bacterium]|nr:tyrosine-type recombinase/integrase [Pseudonocardiales bacterium]
MADYALHVEAVAYLAALRAMDRSPNTERAYAGRVALYLSYAADRGLDWSRPGLEDLARFLRWLVAEPLPARGRASSVEPRFRSKKAANAVMTAVCGFLRFGAQHGWVAPEVVARLWEPKFLAFLPPGYSAGENGQFRTVRAKTIKFTVADEGYEWLSAEQFEQLLGLTSNARDRFMVALIGTTGMRIGETLGLRREDMHLLANSASLGCRVAGPHVHVRRRANANGALAKSRFPRSIPVTEELVELYADYAHERDRVPEAAGADMVFVNLFREPLGRPLGYQNAKGMFDRLARRAGFAVRPHVLRHTAATRWVRSGVPRDVVQALLGHVSPSSLDPYVHASDQDKRDAVERVAALREGRA